MDMITSFYTPKERAWIFSRDLCTMKVVRLGDEARKLSAAVCQRRIDCTSCSSVNHSLNNWASEIDLHVVVLAAF